MGHFIRTIYPDDADGDGQLGLAASRSCRAAADTPPSAVTTPDTLLALRWVARVLTAVWSLVRADLRFWTCPFHKAPAALPRAARFACTFCTADLSSVTAVALGLMLVSSCSDPRSAATSEHNAAEADVAEADADGAAALDEGLSADAGLPDALPPELQAAASSTRPDRRMFRQAGRGSVTLLMAAQPG
jgi:hypothetical protein